MDTQTYLKYADLALPRHTSYPSVPAWSSTWDASRHAAALAATAQSGKALGLYVHVPFCRSLCHYCGCTKEIVSDAQRARQDPAEAYLESLAQEIGQVAAILGRQRLGAVHLGGGTPTFLTPAQLERLWRIITDAFALEADAECAAEVDPRSVALGQLATLQGLGFNRVSLGVQDFDPAVQAAVNRVQPLELVEKTVDEARALGFASINFDLIYGLPRQTLDSMRRTLASVTALAPDRIAFYRLAVLPELFKWQRGFTRGDLPGGAATLALMLQAIEHFTASGYEFIGLDHFARPGDPLVDARDRGELGRSFQGMAPRREQLTIGVGPSAISTLQRAFAQNEKSFRAWRERIATGLATVRGIDLSEDDELRGGILQNIYANGSVDLGADAARRFARELPGLAALEAEGLVSFDGRVLRLTPELGRLLARVVAAVFDAYLPVEAWRTGLAPGLASKIG